LVPPIETRRQTIRSIPFAGLNSDSYGFPRVALYKGVAFRNRPGIGLVVETRRKTCTLPRRLKGCEGSRQPSENCRQTFKRFLADSTRLRRVSE
jgi:hypothetical protein